MIEEAVKRFVSGSKRYTFQTDLLFLTLPRYIWPGGVKKVIKLQEHRDFLLKEKDSEISKNFRSDLTWVYGNIKVDREIPVIIDNQPLWDSLCVKYNVPAEKRGAHYFMLDYLFPEHRLVVEIDGSAYHIPEYDKARDGYVKIEHGLKTVRFSDYGGNLSSLIRDRAKFVAEKAKCPSGCWTVPKYDTSLAQYYTRKNYQAIQLARGIIKYLGPEALGEDSISIGISQVKSFWPDPPRPLILNTMQVMKDLFLVDLNVT